MARACNAIVVTMATGLRLSLIDMLIRSHQAPLVASGLVSGLSLLKCRTDFMDNSRRELPSQQTRANDAELLPRIHLRFVGSAAELATASKPLLELATMTEASSFSLDAT